MEVARRSSRGLSGAGASLLTMTDSSEEFLREPPVAGNETDTLLGSLERERAIFAWKCGGLDADGLATTVGASSMTLGGLLKHLALVEDDYFRRRLHGREYGPPWDTAPFDADPDWEWHSAADDSPDQLYALWEAAVTRSRAAVTEALADGGGMGQLGRFTWPDADPDRPDRGVRTAQRPCRPHQGVGRRRRRRRPTRLTQERPGFASVPRSAGWHPEGGVDAVEEVRHRRHHDQRLELPLVAVPRGLLSGLTPALAALIAPGMRAVTCASAGQIVLWWMPVRRAAAAERNTARASRTP